MGTMFCDRGQERAARSILEPNGYGNRLAYATPADWQLLKML